MTTLRSSTAPPSPPRRPRPSFVAIESDRDDETTAVFVRPEPRRYPETTPTLTRTVDLSADARELGTRALRRARGARGPAPMLVVPSRWPTESDDTRPSEDDTAFTYTGALVEVVDAEALDDADGADAEITEATGAELAVAPGSRTASARWQRALLPIVCLVGAALGNIAWHLGEPDRVTIHAHAKPCTASTAR